MSRLGALGNKLYSGDVAYDFVGRSKRWYVVSALILLVCVGSLIFRGLNFGVEFTGGTVFQVEAPAGSVDEARTAVEDAGVAEASITETNNGRIRVQTEALEAVERAEVATALSETFDVPVDEVDVQFVGPSWGDEITQKAIIGLLAFLVLVVLFLSIYFEWKMAMAALLALVHDVVITIGVYSLVGIEVTPATVVGVLTILGYSLYDTVVVFDKVRENTAGLTGGSRMTYSEAANQAVNQTLVRSINTSIVALLPVIAILIGAVGFLGAATLTQLAVALLVGMAAGTYSSIFIATPFLADLKEREPQMQALQRRVAQRRAGGGTRRSARAVATPASETGDTGSADGAEAASSTAAAPAATGSGPRNQPTRKKRSGGRR
jgi:preprotein translocase subunit SecF